MTARIILARALGGKSVCSPKCRPRIFPSFIRSIREIRGLVFVTTQVVANNGSFGVGIGIGIGVDSDTDSDPEINQITVYPPEQLLIFASISSIGSHPKAAVWP